MWTTSQASGFRERQQQKDAAAGGGDGGTIKIKEATNEDQIVDTLMKLAEMPVSELQSLLEGPGSATNMFQIDKLQQGICPWTSSSVQQLPWLPKKKSLEKSKILIDELQNNGGGNLRKQNQNQHSK